ncbi:actin cytoskeleton protein [Grosmannia clavigera kw1407]|uniref:Actin cytoskeleton protein n=1 Tax=Grosmannia clavigera (strain kw1407 / UAMH 11150) TaxID=655863 RepID=F0XQI8_GROCL|nr:actin cytoskeleton protein [Grosmannia clavigera kw1407]EFX00684.1 actin cytoskeleton protein [Grosmannia clavigera kw1407]
MSSPTTVTVTNIAPATGDKEVQDFFSFCGKIVDIQVSAEGETKSATVQFEKDTAAKTALLLNNTQLGPNHIGVAGTAKPEEPATQGDASVEQHSGELTQEEKPRARIFAEYLAHGYVIGDAALERAIDLDHRHNVTSRFVSKLNDLNSKYHATERAKTADQSYNLTQRANTLLTGLGSYFEKASNSPTGKRVVDFYTLTQRQAKDVHEEARRLAEIKKQEHGGSAYKAAGLEKLFGDEKKFAAPPTTSTSSAAPVTSEAPVPAATTASTGAPVPSSAPKFDPPPTAPTS